MKILIVDDSPIMRKIVKKSLSETTAYCGAQTMDAGDGEEALKAFKGGGIDWVLCDWNMPKMSGIDFVKKARKIKTNKHVPIVMVTTEGTMGKVDEALREGADRYIVKPFTATDLENTMKLVERKMAA